MYEHFRNEFIVAISNITEPSLAESVCKAMDEVAINYEFSQKSTELVVCNTELPQLVKTYLICKRIEGLSEQTIYNYRRHLIGFFLTVQKSPEDVNANDIRAYLYMYQAQRGITNRSLDKLRQHIATFFQWCQNEEYIAQNPARKIASIKYEIKPRKALSQMELEYVRLACNTVRERAMVEVLYSTGCRVSELAALKLSDVDFDAKKVHLFGKGSKHRESFINAKAEVTLKEYLKTRTDACEYLFVTERKPIKQLQKPAIEKIIRELSDRCECDKKFTPHTFRHTTATTAIKNGMPVESIQKMLGHSKIDTTMIYAHADTEMVQNQHAKSII